ncbi:minor capsid protein [Ligilactobacillus acidipiscis]|uniref:minor capsid protein n=1 Tax=Ligilactobacillus acidipiscis TaxID=89059 RepID=UPI0023F96F4C|nr:minor capsid protein [Ligilactobacillus acidipiscis]WEV56132.1 minor capsid protein [Ligilactobacillus acidipiscis]
MKASFDFKTFDRKFSHQSLTQGRIAAANDALQIMNTKYVPMLHTDSNTNLRSLSGQTVNGKQLYWKAPYAHAQFVGVVNGHQVHNYTTPGTSRRWDKRLTGNKSDMSAVSEAFAKGAKWH